MELSRRWPSPLPGPLCLLKVGKEAFRAARSYIDLLALSCECNVLGADGFFGAWWECVAAGKKAG